LHRYAKDMMITLNNLQNIPCHKAVLAVSE